jgi:hypothetical protein
VIGLLTSREAAANTLLGSLTAALLPQRLISVCIFFNPVRVSTNVDTFIE